MVIETLDALAALDYPDFEVLVIDNNTRTRRSGGRSRRTAPKLGAALPLLPRRAARRASRPARSTSRCARRRRTPTVVAVIDSDYIVARDWLRDLVPAFANPRTAIVQAPQDYRDAARERLQGDVLRRVPRLLPHRHGHAQRAQRDHPARHDDAGAPRAARAHRAGPSGASPRTPNSACASSTRATRRPTSPRSYGRGLMPDTFTRLQEAALPLGLRRDADPAAHCGAAVPRPRHAAHARPALPLRRRLAAVARRRLQPAVQLRGARAGRW